MQNPNVTPREAGVDTMQWINVRRGELVLTSMSTMQLKIPGHSYSIEIGETGGWNDILDLLLILVDGRLPGRVELDGEGWNVTFKVYPSFDSAHPNDVWMQAEGVRTGGIRGYDDFRIALDRLQFIDSFFDSIDRESASLSPEELRDNIRFDIEKYTVLKNKWNQNKQTTN